MVFTSFNHALADNFDPGVVGHQLGCWGSVQEDIRRVGDAAANRDAWITPPDVVDSILSKMNVGNTQAKWASVLAQVWEHWNRMGAFDSNDQNQVLQK